MAGRRIEIAAVEHWFPATGPSDRPVKVLEPLSTRISPGEFVSLVGPSGCGKTTVLNLVAGLFRPTTGEVLLDGSPPVVGDPGVGYMLARDGLLPWRTASRNVALPLEIRNVPSKVRAGLVRTLLSSVGLGEFAEAYPAQLSQGMRQRVALARTLVLSPSTLLMDEPFSALDAQTRLIIQEQFLTLWESQHSTVLFVTHDLAEAISLADRVFVFSRRPARVKGEFIVDLPRPRNVIELQGRPAFHDLYQRIWQVLREEVVLSGGSASDIRK